MKTEKKENIWLIKFHKACSKGEILSYYTRIFYVNGIFFVSIISYNDLMKDFLKYI